MKGHPGKSQGRSEMGTGKGTGRSCHVVFRGKSQPGKVSLFKTRACDRFQRALSYLLAPTCPVPGPALVRAEGDCLLEGQIEEAGGAGGGLRIGWFAYQTCAQRQSKLLIISWN